MTGNMNQLNPVGGDKYTHCLFYLDTNGQLAYLNEYCCMDLGYSWDELIAHAVGDLGLLPDCQSLMSMFKLSMRGKTSCIETIVQRKDGETFPAKIVITHTPYGRRILIRCDLYKLGE